MSDDVIKLHNKEDAEPCPFCGSDEHLAYTHIKPKSHHVSCYECMVEGPFAETIEEAVRLWNIRKPITKEKGDLIDCRMRVDDKWYGYGFKIEDNIGKIAEVMRHGIIMTYNEKKEDEGE